MQTSIIFMEPQLSLFVAKRTSIQWPTIPSSQYLTTTQLLNSISALLTMHDVNKGTISITNTVVSLT
jgi:hypothetical protein